MRAAKELSCVVTLRDVTLRRFFVQAFPIPVCFYCDHVQGTIHYDNKTGENMLFGTIHLDDLYMEPAVSLKMCYDLTAYVSPTLYQHQLFTLGLIREEGNYTSMELGREFRCSLFPLLFNPIEPVASVINRYIDSLKGYYVIGVQMRFGGKMANYHEQSFLKPSDLGKLRALINSALERVGNQSVALFISSDSDKGLKGLKKAFERRVKVVTVKEFAVGHSCKGYYHDKKKEKWPKFVQRAIVDLMVLKESDYLIVTGKSSFGEYALDMQYCSYGMIQPAFYASLLHVNRSVFRARSQPGTFSIV